MQREAMEKEASWRAFWSDLKNRMPWHHNKYEDLTEGQMAHEKELVDQFWSQLEADPSLGEDPEWQRTWERLFGEPPVTVNREDLGLHEDYAANGHLSQSYRDMYADGGQVGKNPGQIKEFFRNRTSKNWTRDGDQIMDGYNVVARADQLEIEMPFFDRDMFMITMAKKISKLNEPDYGWLCDGCGTAVKKGEKCSSCGSKKQIRDAPKKKSKTAAAGDPESSVTETRMAECSSCDETTKQRKLDGTWQCEECSGKVTEQKNAAFQYHLFNDRDIDVSDSFF